ncbi:MAG: helix-turn-helix transcriptional regulator [Acidobacteriota bacterium]
MTLKPKKRQEIFIGAKIRQLRKDRGMTQSELAQRIGVQQSDLCRMENGEYKVSLETLFNILLIFNMDIVEFFKDEKRSGLTMDECELLKRYRNLDEKSKLDVMSFIKFKEQQNKTELSHA